MAEETKPKEFTARIWKQGSGSHVITIPIELIQAGYCEQGDILTFKITAGLRNPK